MLIIVAICCSRNFFNMIKFAVVSSKVCVFFGMVTVYKLPKKCLRHTNCYVLKISAPSSSTLIEKKIVRNSLLEIKANNKKF